MSPKNKKKLDIIRKKLDQIDNQLLAIIKKRTFLVNEVVKLKENKSEIVDQKEFPQYSKISSLSQ
jgi:chorismate mutase